MKTMKWLTSCALATIMILSLCACAQEMAAPSDATTVPISTPVPSDPSTSAPTKDESTASESTAPEVTEEWTPEGAVEAKVVTAYTGTVTTPAGSAECTYSLPGIEMPGPYIAKINEEIRNTFLEHAQDYAYSRYQSYVHGNFLTVVIISFTSAPTDSAVEEYTIYTVNIEKCRLATEEEILQAADMTKEEFSEKARTALLQAFLDSMVDSELPYDLSFAEEITDEHLDAAFPYFAEDGTLWVHGIAYQLAGQGTCQCIAPLAE